VVIQVDSRSAYKTDQGNALVQLMHLKAFQGMGTATVTCVRYCTCAPTQLVAIKPRQNSLMFVHQFFVSGWVVVGLGW